MGEVVGLDIDYNAGSKVIPRAVEWAIEEKLDMVVGCSMGGWLASHVGSAVGIPVVMLNPCISPSSSLRKYLNVPEGETDYGGYPLASIKPERLASFIDISKDACGLVLLEEGDKVISSEQSKLKLDKYYDVVLSPGGSHRYESLASKLGLIKLHFMLSELNYGVDS
jgi:predicted esterase YcpF (UPF0227 family)